MVYQRSTAPLAAFATWLAAPQLPGRWLLEQAVAVLRRDVHLEPAFVAYPALPRLATDDPGAAVEVVRLMVTTDVEGWSISGSETEVRAVVSAALDASDPNAGADGRRLAELLLAQGFMSFRELLIT